MDFAPGGLGPTVQIRALRPPKKPVKTGFFHFRALVALGKNAGLITKLITTRGREVLAQVLCQIAAHDTPATQSLTHFSRLSGH